MKMEEKRSDNEDREKRRSFKIIVRKLREYDLGKRENIDGQKK